MTEKEFADSVKTHINTVIRLAFTYMGSYAEAEDVAQDVFLKLYTSDKSFDSAEAQKGWLLRITINQCIDRRRTVWFSRRTELPENLSAQVSEEESSVFEAVVSLKPKYRTIIHLHYYEGYSVKEISEITGLKESAVTMRLKRGRDMLKAILEKENDL